MKIAICFWGLTRSLKFTIESLQDKLFLPLEKHNIQFDKFIHTFYFDGLYNNKHGNEKNVQLDFDEYKLLNPDYFLKENQDEVIKNIDFSKYEFNNTVYNNRTTFRNAILAQYSMKKVTELVENTKIKYDYLLFIRPDCKIVDKFNYRNFLFAKNNRVLSPKFGKSTGLNNRMFIGNYNQGIIFGKSIDYIEEYTNEKVYIAEPFIMWIVKKKMFPNKKMSIKFINFRFQRIRANGEVARLDRRLNK